MNQKPCVLIVEDDPKVVIVVSDVLQHLGYQTLVARNGAEGLRIVEEEIPDLVILDIMMPKIDGYEVCRRLRANPETWYVPILMLTAKGQLHDKVIGLELGADDYLPKPYAKVELEARVKALLRRYPSRRRNKQNHESSLKNKKSSQAYLARLHELLTYYFNEQELQTLSFELGVDYEALAGAGKINKCREFIMYLERRGRISDLKDAGEKHRPQLSWDS
jgi:DNA-binding response OmpR family regulator